MDNTALQSRKAIESLRGGVPSKAVVRALGTDQRDIEEEFRRLAEEVKTQLGPRHLFIRGEFGTGKSHLLIALREAANGLGFCTASLAVSKETPFNLPKAVVSSIADNLSLPNMRGRGLFSAWSRTELQSRSWTEFDTWANAWGLGEGFWSALVSLLGKTEKDNKIFEDVIPFLAGENSLTDSKVRTALEELIPGVRFPGTKPPPRPGRYWQSIAVQARLTLGLGFQGLVVFVDEIELLAQFSRLQRMNAYLNLAKLAGLDGSVELQEAPILLVGAVTSDFASVVFDDKRDWDEVPAEAKRRHGPPHDDVCRKVMEAIRAARPILQPRVESVRETRKRIADLYAKAYPGSAPKSEGEFTLMSTTRMRELIRRWITAWDLERYYGPIELHIESESLADTPTDEVPDLGADGS